MNSTHLFRSLFRGALVALATTSLLAACSDQSPPDSTNSDKILPKSAAARTIASEFVATYYVKSDVQNSIALTIDPLKTRLEAEAADIRKQGDTEPASGKPSIKSSAIGTDIISDSEVDITWELASESGVGLSATTIMTKTDDGWFVSDLKEQQR